MTFRTAGWNTPDQTVVMLSRLGCRAGSRKGADMPLPRWEARSGQEAGPCPAIGEGALADDDITDQV